MFILISTVEREICDPEFFATKSQAQTAMRKELADALHVEINDLDEILVSDNSNCDGTDVGLNEDNAYCTNLNHDNVDWHIFEFDYRYLFTAAQINDAVEVLRQCAFNLNGWDTIMEIIKVFTGDKHI